MKCSFQKNISLEIEDSLFIKVSDLFITYVGLLYLLQQIIRLNK